MNFFEAGFIDQLGSSCVAQNTAKTLYKQAFLDEPEDEEQKKRNRKRLILALSALAGATTLGGIAGAYGAFKGPAKDLKSAIKRHKSDVAAAESDYAEKKQQAEEAHEKADAAFGSTIWRDLVGAANKAQSKAHDAFGRLGKLKVNVPKARNLNSKDLKNGALWALLGAPVGGAVGALGGHVSNKLNDYVGVTPYAVNVRSDDFNDNKKKKKKNK